MVYSLLPNITYINTTHSIMFNTPLKPKRKETGGIDCLDGLVQYNATYYIQQVHLAHIYLYWIDISIIY